MDQEHTAPQEKKRGRGQPRKITAHIARKIFLLYAKGLTDQEIADVFGMHVDTIAEFKKDAKYSETVRKCKDEADLRVINSLYRKAIGFYPEDKAFCHEGKIIVGQTHQHAPSEGACIMWLVNRRRDEWRKEIPPDESIQSKKPPVIRLISRDGETEAAAIRASGNQVDVLLGPNFVADIKNTGENGHSNGSRI